MILIVGLGNPGSKYQNNRHNVGHIVIDALKGTSKGLTLLKPDCFMNDSGSFIAEKLKAYSLKPEVLYVVHDDLDIPLGSFKIQFGKGPKDHKGLKSIYEALGTRDFWHVRVGIENRIKDVGSRIKGEQYVLEDFIDEEKIILERVIKQICNQLEV